MISHEPTIFATTNQYETNLNYKIITGHSKLKEVNQVWYHL